jgi:AraC-like DNA-binding protein
VLNWVMMIDGWSALTYMVLTFEVVMPGWTTGRRLMWSALPFMVFTLIYAWWPRRSVIYAYSLFLWLFAWGIVIVGWVKMHRYLNYICMNYSNINEIDVSWLRPVFLFAIIGQLAWLFTSLYSNITCDIVYYISVIVLWLVVLRYSWNFQPIAIGTESEEAETSVYDGSLVTITDEASQGEVKNLLSFGRLEKLMDEEKPYLRPSLTLKELAHELNTNRTYISNYLNQQMKMTFYDYINSLRIERAAIPLMREHPEYKYEYVASESGFASISTFRRAFVKVTGQTPSQYAAALSAQK